jgi:hypothetical protein
MTGRSSRLRLGVAFAMLALAAAASAAAKNRKISASPKVTVVESVTGQGVRKDFTPTGALALVAYEWTLAKAANGGARQPFVGDLVLVVPTDSFTGAREIQALKSLELRHVGDPVVK